MPVLAISFGVASMALGQSKDCPSASEATPKDMGDELHKSAVKYAITKTNKAQQNHIKIYLYELHSTMMFHYHHVKCMVSDI